MVPIIYSFWIHIYIWREREREREREILGPVDPENLLHGKLDSPHKIPRSSCTKSSCSCQVKFSNCFSKGFGIFSRRLHVFTSTPQIFFRMTNCSWYNRSWSQNLNFNRVHWLRWWHSHPSIAIFIATDHFKPRFNRSRFNFLPFVLVHFALKLHKPFPGQLAI